MTREELKEHCKKTIEQCEMWAIHRGEEPSGKVYEEHKTVLDILEQESCDDVISREAVLEYLKSNAEDFPDYHEAIEKVVAMPSIQPSRPCNKCAMNGSGSKYCDNCGQKSGHWIKTNSGYECSECAIESRSKSDFCPSCGADMRGAE